MRIDDVAFADTMQSDVFIWDAVCEARMKYRSTIRAIGLQVEPQEYIDASKLSVTGHCAGMSEGMLRPWPSNPVICFPADLNCIQVHGNGRDDLTSCHVISWREDQFLWQCLDALELSTWAVPTPQKFNDAVCKIWEQGGKFATFPELLEPKKIAKQFYAGSSGTFHVEADVKKPLDLDFSLDEKEFVTVRRHIVNIPNSFNFRYHNVCYVFPRQNMLLWYASAPERKGNMYHWSLGFCIVDHQQVQRIIVEDTPENHPFEDPHIFQKIANAVPASHTLQLAKVPNVP